MKLHNCVILALIPFHVAHDFVLELPKIILECLIEGRNLFLEGIT